MDNPNSTIKSLYFNDIVEKDFMWDVVYEDCGIAFRDGIQQFFTNGGTWEINMVVFVVCLKGQLQFSEIDKIISLKPGDVLIRMPGSIVSGCMVSPDFKCKVLCLSPDVLAKHTTETGFFDRALRIIDNPVINMGYNDDSIRLMKAYETILKIKSEHNEQQNYKIIITHIIECLLYEIFNKIPVVSTLDVRQSQGSKYVLFNSFVELLTRDKGLSRSVKAYASQLHVSPKYLSAVCRKFSGKSAFDWINDTLKKEIERLLHYTDLSVKEISVRLSFPDCSFFSKYVRQHFNMTALEYRAKLRSGGEIDKKNG